MDVLQLREGFQSSTIPPGKLPVIHDAVLAAYNILDGVKDGFLTDPRRCRFDPAKLLCKGGDEPNLPHRTPGGRRQEGLRRDAEPSHQGADSIQDGPKGSEVTRGGIWTDMALAEPSFEDLFASYRIFEDPNWDWRRFDFDQDMERTDAKTGGHRRFTPART